MGCQSRDYKQSDGFMSIYYLGESITSGICGINNQFKSLMGGKKSKKSKRSKKIRKTQKYKQYTNAKRRSI